MTSVTSGVQHRTRYVWTVPCRHHYSAVVGDVQDALLFAETTARTLGVRTDTATWLNVQPGDDEIKVWFEVEDTEPPVDPWALLGQFVAFCREVAPDGATPDEALELFRASRGR